MEAIAGIAGIHVHPGSRDTVQSMFEFLTPNSNKSGKLWNTSSVCLCHVPITHQAHIAINPQPICDSKTSVSLVFDGNIYNSDQLTKELSSKGCVLQSVHPAELALHLYLAYGMNCLNLLRGDFAFAVWDARTNKLFLARDRFGIKPLFYYHQEGRGQLLFASTLDALTHTKDISNEINLESIYHYLFLTFLPQPQTPIKHLYSVLPASFIEYDINTDRASLVKYWDFPCIDQKLKCDDEEIIEECGRLLCEAISLRNPGNGTPGISLSSGMDSCTIAALLANSRRDLKTFTFGFGDKYEKLNEFALSYLVSQKIGSQHTEIRISANDFLSQLPNLIKNLDTPTTGAILPYYFLKTAKLFGIDVAFRGDGGNSAFQYLIDDNMPALDKAFTPIHMLPKAIALGAFGGMDAFIHFLKTHRQPTNDRIEGALGLLSRYFSFKAGTSNFDTMFTKAERRSFFRSLQWSHDTSFEETNMKVLAYYDGTSKDFYERYNYGDFRVYLDQGPAHLGSLSRAHAVDLRLPYFDHILIEFIQRSVPSAMRKKDGIDKYILKRIGNSVLPPEIINRAPRGFYMPFKDWLKTDLKPIVDDVFSENTISRRGIFDYRALRAVYDQFYRHDDSLLSWRKIWIFVVLEIWLRLHYD